MEGYRATTYGDAFANVYDDWYGEITDVGATVAAVVRRTGVGGRVLELGVGTGRLAIPLADAGLHVVGVDSSALMLDRCRAKHGAERVALVLGDMAAIDAALSSRHLSERFDVALCAFNTLFNLTSEQDQRACLAGVAAWLNPTGRLAVEASLPPPSDAPTDDVAIRHLALDCVVLTVARHDAAEQTIAGHHMELRDGAEVRLRPWKIRYLSPHQLDEMATAAGLVLDTRSSDWSGTPLSEDNPNHVSWYRKA